MKLSFEAKKMLLASFNARAEIHGEEREPAADIKLEVNVPNDFLSQLHPALKSSLYFLDTGRPADLADQGKASEPGFLPHLRFPVLGEMLSWNDEMTGASVIIRLQGAPDGVETRLEGAKINALKLEPKDGGTVTISMRVQCHPDKAQSGELSHLVQREVDVTIS